MRTLNLIHLANHKSTNIGNGALTIGTENVLAEDLPCAVNFTPEPWDDYTFGFRKFDANFVRRVNDSDGLLIGAAVALNARDYLVHAGMRFDLPVELWSQITKPIVFYGISYRVWPCQKYCHLDKFRTAMEHILRHPKIIFSVRNDGTKGWLESLLGYESDRILTVPDPAIYVETATGNVYPELVGNKINAILSLNNEDEVYRFGGWPREQAWRWLGGIVNERKLIQLWKRLPGWDHKRSLFLRQLARGLEIIAKEHDLNLILCPHYFDDYEMMSQFIKSCPLRMPHQDIVSTGLLKASEARYFYGRYANVDVALSMRVHSMSPAIGVGTPMIALTSQPRMTEFLDDIGLEEFGLDIFDRNLADKLVERFNHCITNRDSIRDRLNTVRSGLRRDTREFNQKVQELLLP